MNYNREKELMLARVAKYELSMLNMNRDSAQWNNLRELIDSINLLIRSADSEIYKAEQSEKNIETRFRGIGTELKNNWNRKR